MQRPIEPPLSRDGLSGLFLLGVGLLVAEERDEVGDVGEQGLVPVGDLLIVLIGVALDADLVQPTVAVLHEFYCLVTGNSK